MSVMEDRRSGEYESGNRETKVADQARLQQRLRKAIRQSGNEVCVDCGTPRPRWATLIVQEEGHAIGGFCCLECSGAHRRLGTHVTFVRSVDLDTWKEKEVQALELAGNEHVNSLYQSKLSDIESALKTAQHNHPNADNHPLFSPQELQQPDCTLRLSPHDTQEQRWRFIKDKYERRRFSSMDVPASPSAWKKRRPLGIESSPLPNLVPTSSTEDSTGSNHADEPQQRAPTPSGYMKNFKFKWKKKMHRSTPSSPRRFFHPPNYNEVTDDNDSSNLNPPVLRNSMVHRPAAAPSIPNFEDVFNQAMLGHSESEDSNEDSLDTYVTMKQNGDVEVVAKDSLLFYHTDDVDDDDDEVDDDMSAVSGTSSIRGRIHENYKKSMRQGKRFLKQTFTKSKHTSYTTSPTEVSANMGNGCAI